MQIFYSPNIIEGGFTTLDAEESRHAVRVLRMKKDDIIHVTDGCGTLFECRIADADENQCLVVTTGKTTSTDSTKPKLHLWVGPTKNPSRMEWLVEKAVEVGLTDITLLQCEHSERTFMKTDRLQRVALSAMKQSLHTTLPKVHPVVELTKMLDGIGYYNNCLKLIAHCESDKPRLPLASALEAGRDTIVMIGPEGDFSQTEIEKALKCGFQPVSLGPSRLRTETAALYATVSFSLINDAES